MQNNCLPAGFCAVCLIFPAGSITFLSAENRGKQQQTVDLAIKTKGEQKKRKFVCRPWNRLWYWKPAAYDYPEVSLWARGKCNNSSQVKLQQTDFTGPQQTENLYFFLKKTKWMNYFFYSSRHDLGGTRTATRKTWARVNRHLSALDQTGGGIYVVQTELAPKELLD